MADIYIVDDSLFNKLPGLLNFNSRDL